jgi:hypothetical protein
MFATIKSLIPEPRQADQPRRYVGRHRKPDPITAEPVTPVSPAPISSAPVSSAPVSSGPVFPAPVSPSPVKTPEGETAAA